MTTDLSLDEWIRYACRESTLHGLGHLALFHPEAVPVIDAFLTTPEGVRPELLDYARQARTGCVL